MNMGYEYICNCMYVQCESVHIRLFVLPYDQNCLCFVSKDKGIIELSVDHYINGGNGSCTERSLCQTPRLHNTHRFSTIGSI